MMKKSNIPTIAITGAAGFLGAELVRHFIKKKWKVVALVRDPQTKKDHGGVEYRYYDLEKPVPKSTLANVDYLVHAAYIKSGAGNSDALDGNISGAKRIIAAAKVANINKCIFISTMSAHEDAISIYGKQKLEVENLFLKTDNSTVLKCGLIIGNGGIVKEMASFMKSKHTVPLVGGGNQPLQIVSVYDLVSVIESVITQSISGKFVIATPRIYSYRQFYAALAKELGIRVAYIPVPYGMLEGIFKTAAFLHIPLGVGEDNLKGLKKLKSMNSKSDLEKIGVKLKNLDEALKMSGIRG